MVDVVPGAEPIERAPCDTALGEGLDEVDPRQLRDVFKRVFAVLQRAKGLEGFTCLDGHHLLSVDGTGYFSLSSVDCAQWSTAMVSAAQTRSRRPKPGMGSQ